MGGLKISAPGLFRFLALLLALTASLQAQACTFGCENIDKNGNEMFMNRPEKFRDSNGNPVARDKERNFVPANIDSSDELAARLCAKEWPRTYDCLHSARQSFEKVDVVAAIRFVGVESESEQYRAPRLKYEIVKSWKSDLKPGMFITLYPPTGMSCESHTTIRVPPKNHSKEIIIAYLQRSTHAPDPTFVREDICSRHIRESEEGYAETVRWLDERVKQPSR